MISESTWNLAGGAFNYQDLGPQILKGIPTPARAWAVVGENSADSRFAARASKGVTPLVGRTDEIGMMRQRWARAVDGDGQVILLSAPAGMGKSRMTQAFRDGLGEVRPILHSVLLLALSHQQRALSAHAAARVRGRSPTRATRPIKSSTSSKPRLWAPPTLLRRRSRCSPRCCRSHTRSDIPS